MLISAWRSAITSAVTSESCQHLYSVNQEVEGFWPLCVFWAKECFLYVYAQVYALPCEWGVESFWGLLRGFLFAVSLWEISLFWWSCCEAFYVGYGKGSCKTHTKTCQVLEPNGVFHVYLAWKHWEGKKAGKEAKPIHGGKYTGWTRVSLSTRPSVRTADWEGKEIQWMPPLENFKHRLKMASKKKKKNKTVHHLY